MLRRSAAALAAVLCAVLGVVLATRALAQDFAGPRARVEKAAFETAKVRRGGTAKVLVVFDIAPKQHVYSASAAEGQRPDFRWELPAGWTLDGVLTDVTEPHVTPGPVPEKLFEGSAVMAQHFRVAADAALGPVELRAVGEFLVCDENTCEPVKDVAIAATGEVVEAEKGAALPPPGDPWNDDSVPRSDSVPLSDGGWGSILGQAVLWGFLTVLTPCVFPLLPVTVSFFSKQGGHALPRAITYALGIVFTITVIGLVFKSSLDAMARGWIFNLVIGVLFVVLALSLFGLFDLRLPGFLTEWSTSKHGSGGYVGAFFMAMTLALTSFSCSMPFLTIMFTQFERGDATQSVVGLVVYGATMALPFFLCCLFPSAIRTVPRSGAWMNAIKVTMGFVEFGLAFKFLRTVALSFEETQDVLPRGFVLAIWAACAFGAALYLFGHVVLPHDTKPESIGVIRLVFAISFLSGALYLLPGIHGTPRANWIEAFIQTQPSELDTGHLEWPRDDWDGALAEGRAADKPVLLDFTGVG